MSETPALTLLAELLDVPAPPGHETAMASYLREKITALGYKPETDSAGNILVRISGSGARSLLCLAAHMDEIAMVVTAIEPNGTLRVDRSGGLYPWKLGEGPVDLLGDNATITGILSMGSTHTPGAGDQAIKWSQVRILTGLSPQELAEKGIRPGTHAVPTRTQRGPIRFGPQDDPLVAAWTFDDRMGVVTLLRLLDELNRRSIQPHHPMIIAFTVHEEGGGHGAKVLAQRERPDFFVAVDGCPIPPGAPLQLDGRPGIWAKDRTAVYDPGLLVALRQAATQAGTELQPVVYDGAASDASLVYAAGGAGRVACFGHVRENSHGYEVARLSVFDAMLETLVKFVQMDLNGTRS